MEKNRILNIDICSVSLDDLLKTLKKGVVVTPNVDHLVKLQRDPEFYEAYSQAEWVICDSNILNLSSRLFLGTSFKEVIPGSSFLPAYYTYHKDNEAVKIFLLGAAEGVAAEAMKRINAKTGREIVVGAMSPSFGFEKKDEECARIIETVNRSGANVLVIGVGAPKQEKWLLKYKSQLPGIDIFMALGATIDFEAGNIKRAPEWIQRLHIEWLYRIAQEPERLWRRYLIDDPAFFIMILKQRFRLYRNPF
ncbi:WecB/TagA/CpsF family glycosyltransferase [Siphonobacter aquaeclarae]|uniref:Polymer biosynthesis protein, WecB/TagA/CpsF family n=1 Tax=Siphonobacter aquaeclarae TaxID=563176 RepID=A0A1G9V792_9BACT|nr:WecB/TagA/CpsF family glycosyltransferase [Siphonobacter aquaeclarae]SDM68031.1 polymer biosynthesis protein, WecB/TagA/CpsF family [Siphonobacter aquaeclarae]